MRYSFVIPCYQSECTIESVVNELMAEAAKEQITDYEIILVNDCSPDGAWNVIQSLTYKYRVCCGINLAKNFGQHAALLAGYSRSTGDVIISLDDDGQTPVDELGKLIDKLNDGNDVVYAYYEDRNRSKFRRFGTFFATQMSKKILGAPKDFRGSSFFCAKRFVIDEMLKYDNAYPYLLGLVLRTTQKIGYVKTDQRKRSRGRSGYNFHKLIVLWLNGFTAFSVKPLEIGTWIGIIFAIIGFLGVVITFVNKCMHPEVVAGWSSLISVNLIVGGVILLMLGMIGEYVGRIYICINKAPQYVIREEITRGEDGEENK